MRKVTRNFITLFCILAVLAGFPSIGEANNNVPSQEQQIIDGRIDISPSDLLIREDGIFLIKADNVLPLPAVYVDSKGLFIIDPTVKKEDKIWNACGNGHEIYHYECGGCAHWWCPFRCKCHSPWINVN
jgi:hypothetical protein